MLLFPSARLVGAVLLAAVPLVAQAAPPVQLPQWFHLGPIPKGATVITVAADGSASDARGKAGEPAALVRAAKAPLALRVDAMAGFAVVDAMLRQARAAGHATVLLPAKLPDGTEGAFTLALPATDGVTTTTLRLTYERAGVPADSVTPLLRRIRSAAKGAFVVDCAAPPDARWGGVLPVLAAVADAGVTMAKLRVDASSSGAGMLARALSRDDAPRLLPALDLGPVPELQVQAQAVPKPKPHLDAVAFGCIERPVDAPLPMRAGAAGGVDAGATADPDDVVAPALAWLAAHQLLDGAFAHEGERGAVAATSLAVLSLLGRGHSMTNGHHAEVVRRAIGWLLATQHADGAFVDDGPGALRDHALACWAFAEAEGMTGDSGMLRASLRDGVQWLMAQVAADGGFGERARAATGDSETTALVVMVCVSAGFFGFEHVDGKQVAAWFDGHPAPTPRARAAELFARFVTGQDPQHEAMVGLIDQVAAAGELGDPWAAYWTTFALFQAGGAPWQRWAARLPEALQQNLHEGDDSGAWPPAGGRSMVETTTLRVLTAEALQRFTRRR